MRMKGGGLKKTRKFYGRHLSMAHWFNLKTNCQNHAKRFLTFSYLRDIHESLRRPEHGAADGQDDDHDGDADHHVEAQTLRQAPISCWCIKNCRLDVFRSEIKKEHYPRTRASSKTYDNSISLC